MFVASDLVILRSPSKSPTGQGHVDFEPLGAPEHRGNASMTVEDVKARGPYRPHGDPSSFAGSCTTPHCASIWLHSSILSCEKYGRLHLTGSTPYLTRLWNMFLNTAKAVFSSAHRCQLKDTAFHSVSTAMAVLQSGGNVQADRRQ